MSTTTWLAGRLALLGISREEYHKRSVGRQIETGNGRKGKVVDIADTGLVVEFGDGQRETVNPMMFMASRVPFVTTGNTAADARRALDELDAIRRGEGPDYGAMARETAISANARGVKPVASADVEAALAGGRAALDKRAAERAAATPSFSATVFGEVEKLMGRRTPA